VLEHLNERPTPPKRVVVMGAGGFVGGAVAERLGGDGIAVLALGRTDVDLLAPRADERLAGLIEPGDTFVAVSARAPAKDAEMLIENMTMARAMVRALKARDGDLAHVVNISSDAVYADAPLPLTEDSPTSPASYHGVMHLAREIMFRSELATPFAIVRPTLVYGARDPHNGYGPNRFRRLAAVGQEIVLFGEGEERRDHVLIDDVAEVILRVVTYRSRGVLNVASGRVASFRGIAEMIAAHFKPPVAVKGSPRTCPMPHGGYRPFDVSACRKAFPDFLFTPLAEGLAKVRAETAGGGR
jgi:nucleoside-diphosphate-sugar epimerase